MKKVYETLDPLMTGHLRNLLEKEGIECVIGNEYLASVAGGIPPSECWYEIRVMDDELYEEARKLIRDALSESRISGSSTWVCANCGEVHEDQFTVCWNCGRERT